MTEPSQLAACVNRSKIKNLEKQKRGFSHFVNCGPASPATGENPKRTCKEEKEKHTAHGFESRLIQGQGKAEGKSCINRKGKRLNVPKLRRIHKIDW